MNINEIRAELKKQYSTLERDFSVQKLGIFGSFVRGEQNDDSDVDILVEFLKPIGFFHLIRLENHLSQLLGREIDLVTKNALKLAIKDEILSQAVMI